MPTLLKDLRINEVSSVDRGAGEGVKIMLMKRAAAGGGTTPIKTGDLENLSKGDGNMADEDKRKAEAEKAEKEKAEKAATDKLAGERDEAVKALDLAKREIAVLKMSQKHKDYMGAADMSDSAKDAFAAKSPDERDAHMDKNPLEKRLPDYLRKQLADAEDDRKVLKMLREKDEAATFAKRALSLGLPEDAGDMLRKAYQGDATAIAKLEATLKSLAAQVATGALFKEFGSANDRAGTVADEMAAKADALRKVETKLTEAQAFTRVYTDPANGELKKRYDAEQASLRRSA